MQPVSGCLRPDQRCSLSVYAATAIFPLTSTATEDSASRIRIAAGRGAGNKGTSPYERLLAKRELCGRKRNALCHYLRFTSACCRQRRTSPLSCGAHKQTAAGQLTPLCSSQGCLMCGSCVLRAAPVAISTSVAASHLRLLVQFALVHRRPREIIGDILMY